MWLRHRQKWVFMKDPWKASLPPVSSFVPTFTTPVCAAFSVVATTCDAFWIPPFSCRPFSLLETCLLRSSVIPYLQSLSLAGPTTSAVGSTAPLTVSVCLSEFPCLRCHYVWDLLTFRCQAIELCDPSFPTIWAAQSPKVPPTLRDLSVSEHLYPRSHPQSLELA